MSKLNATNKAIAKLTELSYEMVTPSDYKTSNTRTLIRCKIHDLTWESTVGEAYRKVKHCSKCRENDDNWESAAAAKGYKILNIDGDDATFQCSNNHEPWTTKRSNIKFTQCKYCSGKKISRQTFIDKINSRGFELLNPNDIETSNSQGIFKCAKNHEWKTQIHNVFAEKSGCPHCSESSGERRCRFILETIFEKPFRKTRDVVVVNGQRLELDMYNDELKIACEYNGVQHYKEDKKFFHKNGGFEEQQARDESKRRYCEDNGIKLVEVPYTIIKFLDVVKFITTELQIDSRIDWPSKEIEFNTVEENNYYSNEDEIKELRQFAAAKEGTYLKTQNNGDGIRRFFRCKNGHEFNIHLNKLRGGSWCIMCSASAPVNNEIVSQKLATIKMKRLTDYVKSDVPMMIKCDHCGSSYGSNWDNIVSRELKKRACRMCNASSFKLQKIQSKLDTLGLKFKDKLFVDAKTHYVFVCELGHENIGNWNAIRVRLHGCKHCSRV